MATVLKDGQMIEGFICPVCLKDLAQLAKLHAHFQEEHSEDDTALKLFKEFFGHTKKILKLNKEGAAEDGDKQSKKLAEIFHSAQLYDCEQSFGKSRKLTSEFTIIRTKRMEGFSSEINKIIIRLDKLLLNMPADPKERKAYEQSVVPWLDGSIVSRCPDCTHSFHLARRQHHCRLCGSIMCADCSHMLAIPEAKRMVGQNENLERESGEALRCCAYCAGMLESREAMKSSRTCNPPICQLYDSLHRLVGEINERLTLFEKMSLSLNEGQRKYHLDDARELWQITMKLAEKIEAISESISRLGAGGRVSDAEARLQAAVRMGVSCGVRRMLLRMPPLPDDKRYEELVERRRRKAEDRVAREKLEEIVGGGAGMQFTTEYLHSKPSPPSSSGSGSQNSNTTDEGWVPMSSNTLSNEDPLVQQIINIRNYIRQAREQLKFDEVASLEANLRELKEEYFRQRQNKSG